MFDWMETEKDHKEKVVEMKKLGINLSLLGYETNDEEESSSFPSWSTEMIKMTYRLMKRINKFAEEKGISYEVKTGLSGIDNRLVVIPTSEDPGIYISLIISWGFGDAELSVVDPLPEDRFVTKNYIEYSNDLSEIDEDGWNEDLENNKLKYYSQCIDKENDIFGDIAICLEKMSLKKTIK
ncbi:hypothetical protein [Paenibacillus donghaensis]|uniref:Uncharacterized protein n=1 Tax=Paenibacillus donghaensis TaxID=414771 RepID=A0A2Z2KDD3_9BACL|nr:hypothetical protein [Paenibacillus donghaensis]ASA21805.1 hypothetical protein B9T62_14105 [Paenibacillus donghaensis]